MSITQLGSKKSGLQNHPVQRQGEDPTEMLEMRLEQIEAMLSRHEEMLRQLTPPRGGPQRATELVPVAHDDIALGREYIFKVANPRKSYLAKVMVYNTSIDPKSGVTVFNLIRPDTDRKYQSRPTSEFFKVPNDWDKDPADTGEDEESTRPETHRPQSNKSIRPARSVRSG